MTELQNELQEREGYEKAQREQLQLLDFKYNLLLDMVRVASCPSTEPHRLQQASVQTSGRFSARLGASGRHNCPLRWGSLNWGHDWR